MYQIMYHETGAAFALTERPNYITRAENGCFVLCSREEATGLAWEGTPYALLGKDLEGAAGTVLLAEADGGREIRALETAAEDTDAMLVDQELRLTLMELGIENTTEGGN